MKETLSLAREAGYKGIIIFGEPDYYPRLGFETCDRFGITTASDKNFDAFMVLELAENSLKEIKGKVYVSSVFENVSEENADVYNTKFPYLTKRPFPRQWE